ncbi:MAG: hypothetical protein V7K90_15530 [Nostoc sp.]|uniref:hypothetical protein n=1 Tax=Nostoc sp. TaxID=1180 RepID=UPI002FF4631C
MLDWWEKNFATCELSDRPLILASRSHPRLQLIVQSGFWLVLPEKGDAGFPVVNPGYGDRPTLTCAIAPSGAICIMTYNGAHHPPQITFEFQQIPSRRSVCMGVVRLRSHLLKVHNPGAFPGIYHWSN